MGVSEQARLVKTVKVQYG